MDLLKHRRNKDIQNQKIIQDILKGDMVQRYRFGSISEMAVIRELMLDKIMTEKLNTTEDLQKYDNIKELLKEFFYIESLDQLDNGDYIRYINFNKSGDFELKQGGIFVKHENNYIILKSSHTVNQSGKQVFWKITDNNPIFCRLSDHDKMVLILMEKTIEQ